MSSPLNAVCLFGWCDSNVVNGKTPENINYCTFTLKFFSSMCDPITRTRKIGSITVIAFDTVANQLNKEVTKDFSLIITGNIDSNGLIIIRSFDMVSRLDISDQVYDNMILRPESQKPLPINNMTIDPINPEPKPKKRGRPKKIKDNPFEIIKLED